MSTAAVSKSRPSKVRPVPFGRIENWVTLADVGRILNLNHRKVVQLVNTPALDASVIDGKLRVHSTKLDAYLARVSR